MRKDPYRVLGLPHGASPALILEAYRRLIKEHHPDRNGGSAEATARTQEIQLAFEELRARPAPDGSIDERLARLEAELDRREPAKPAPDPSVVRVTTLMDGLDDLASRLDELS